MLEVVAVQTTFSMGQNLSAWSITTTMCLKENSLVAFNLATKVLSNLEIKYYKKQKTPKPSTKKVNGAKCERLYLKYRAGKWVFDDES